MVYHVPEDFQRKLDEFNASQVPRVSDITVCWDPHKSRWAIYAIPVSDTSHPHYRPDATRKLLTNFVDGSGRRGVYLGSWAQRANTGHDIGFMPLDDRFFHALKYADTFSSRTHFEDTIEKTEARAELEQNARIRDIAYGARSYWWNLDRPTIGQHARNPGWRGQRAWR